MRRLRAKPADAVAQVAPAAPPKTREMTDMAKRLEFEKAAVLRDEIERIKAGKDLSR